MDANDVVPVGLNHKQLHHDIRCLFDPPTDISPTQASATDLLTLRCGHWAIENQSHWVRAVVLAADVSQVQCGVIPQVMSALRNTALAVLRFAD